jgi:tetratricopeptide (TPR) repeat protein
LQIRDQRFADAIQLLNNVSQGYQQVTSICYYLDNSCLLAFVCNVISYCITLQSRAALSLLGYCYYQSQDFVSSADCYEHLSQLCPENEDYRIYYCQSLYNAGLFDEAMKVSFQVENPKQQDKVRTTMLNSSQKVVNLFESEQDNNLLILLCF